VLCFVKLPAATKKLSKFHFFGFFYLFALYVAEAGGGSEFQIEIRRQHKIVHRLQN